MTDTPYALGCLIRPTDPREFKYHARLALTGTADLTQFRSLASFKGVDVRPEIMDQNGLGACASYSAIGCARICDVVSGREPASPMLAGDALYEAVRKVMGTFPQDSGSYLATNLDLIMNHGVPLESEAPEHHQAAFDYGAAWDTDAAPHEWIAAHHPAYPTEADFVQNIWLALDSGLPLHVGVQWPRAWLQPRQGVVDDTVTPADSVGGHAFYCHSFVPQGHPGVAAAAVEPLLGFANQWTAGWSADAPASGVPGARPGDFYIPLSAFQRMCFEVRAVSPRPFTPDPKPQPKPEPKPAPDPSASYWAWLELAAQYGKRTDVTPALRSAEAAQVLHQTRRFYPAVKEVPA